MKCQFWLGFKPYLASILQKVFADYSANHSTDCML